MNAADGFFDRLLESAHRGVALFLRQSTLQQRRFQIGSQHVQREQLKYLEAFKVPPDRVHIIDALGESGSAGIRPKFELLCRLITAGQVGIVVLAKHDRLGRDEIDSARAYELMRKHDVLLMVDGRIFDPSDDNDDFVLGIYAKFAAYENRARTRWLALTRYAKAERLEERVRLASGLVWASPDDPAYVRAATDAGLAEHLLSIGTKHRARSAAGGKSHYVLPYPDAAVYQSVALRLAWATEGGGTSVILRRIRTDPAWPKPGLIPVAGGSRYRPDVPPRWVPATHSKLRRWFKSPSLYGRYRFTATALERGVARGHRRRVPDHARVIGDNGESISWGIRGRRA